jgi:hypothetical protein
MPGLSLYLPPSEDIQSAVPAGLVFGESLELTESMMDAHAVPAGEALPFTLTWTALEKLSSDVELDLSLVDERDHRWLQWQRIPGQWANPPSNWEPGETFVDRQGVIVPQGAPPGRYWVRMAVVDRDSGEPLMGFPGSGQRRRGCFRCDGANITASDRGGKRFRRAVCF